MDGVSGIIAVVSFSIQLVETIQKAKKFFKEVQDAPEELIRLVDTLDRLQSLLIAADHLVEQQNKMGSLPGAVDTIDRALRRCQSTVKKLDTSVNAIKPYFKVQGRGRKTWAKLKTVVKKEEVRQLRKQVYESMKNLETALILNNTHLQLDQIELISTRLLPNIPTQPISSTTITSMCSRSQWKNPGPRPTDHIIKSKETDIWRYWGFFGRIILREKTKFLRTNGNTPEEIINQEKCLLFISSFLRKAFELRYHGWVFQLPRTLTSFPLISSWVEVSNLCKRGHIDLFYQALSRGELPLFARDEWGRTLLHTGSQCGNAEVCQLLIRLGVDPDHTDISGRKAMHLVNDRDVNTMRIVAAAQDDLTPEDLFQVFNSPWSASPETTDLLLSLYGFSDEINCADGLGFSPLDRALCEYGSGRREWATLIRRLLRHKVDIHARGFSLPDIPSYWIISMRWQIQRTHPERTFTPLDELFLAEHDPIQAGFCAQEWLLMLEEAGYDVNAYLKKEKQLHSSQNFLSYPACPSIRFVNHYMPRQLVFEIGDNPNVYWDWWINPSSPASLVLQEFRHMNPYYGDMYFERDDSWTLRWPYDYPHWSEIFMPCLPTPKQEWKKRAAQAARRYARQAKRKYPGDFKDNDENSAIPGAWIEDEC